MNFRQVLMLVIISTLVLSACSKKINVRRYYVIEMPAPAVTAPLDSTIFDWRVDVRDFNVARAFDQTRIALRTESNELNYYFYHHWAVKPSQAVADFIYELVQQEKMFSRIFRGTSYNPDFLIAGEVKSLERVQERKKTIAHVHVAISLLDARTEKTLVQYEENQKMELQPDNSMNTFAQITSDILKSTSAEFLDRVRLYLQERNLAAEQ